MYPCRTPCVLESYSWSEDLVLWLLCYGANTDPGYVQVVTEPAPWKGGLVAISNFGFGGSNVHCVVSSAADGSKPLATTPSAEEVAVSHLKIA